jgi:hypothetical protein
LINYLTPDLVAMKKTKAIRLVLITGLFGGAAPSFSFPHFYNTPSERIQGSSYSADKIYGLSQDSLTHRSSSGSVAHPEIQRGGWGFFGHHSSAS